MLILTGFQHLAAAKMCNQEKDLSVKTCFGKIQKNHILAEAAILCRESQEASLLGRETNITNAYYTTQKCFWRVENGFEVVKK